MRKTARARRAFTLVELLAVIAVIAILAALLLPMIGHSMERGRRTQCLSNLRQWGAGLNLYLSDNKGKFPAQGSGGGGLADPLDPDAWFNVIPPYVGEPAISNLWILRKMPRPRQKSLFICPSSPTAPAPNPSDNRTYYCSYSYNLWIEARDRGCAASGGPTRYSDYLRLSQIKNPTVFAVFADNPPGIGENGNYGYLYAWTHPKYMAYPSDGDAFRHNDAANICFADGHVATYQRDQIYTDGMEDSDGKYWNYGGVQWNPDNTNLNGECSN